MSGIVENISHLSSVPNLRQISEKRVSHTSENAPNASVDELLQELRMHQIELEMQNKALRQSQLVLEESLNRYVSLYEFAPVGYLTLTENGTIAEANLVVADLLGENRSILIKQHFPRFVLPENVIKI